MGRYYDGIDLFTGESMTKEQIAKFKEWLALKGAELLAETNQWELVRFKARGGTHVVYMNAKGKVSVSGFAEFALNAFLNHGHIEMGIRKTKGLASKTHRLALFERDGRECFYCGKDMPDDDMTVEHLLSRDKGGPNRIENMALAHGDCNQAAANMILTDKIKLREKLRAA